MTANRSLYFGPKETAIRLAHGAEAIASRVACLAMSGRWDATLRRPRFWSETLHLVSPQTSTNRSRQRNADTKWNAENPFCLQTRHRQSRTAQVENLLEFARKPSQ